MNTPSLTIPSLFLSVLLVSAGFAASPAWEPDGIPYEITRAGRTADDHVPVVPFEDAAGWTVRGENAVASLGVTTDHRLFGKGSLVLTYRATTNANPHTAKTVVCLEPDAPIELPKDFDAISIWCYGNNNYGKNAKLGPTPMTTLFAEFDDGKGGRIENELEYVNHCEWFLSIQFIPKDRLEKIRQGGNRLLGFQLRGGYNTTDREICLTSFCAFENEEKPLKFAPRAKRGVRLFKDAPQGVNTGEGTLPFPTGERTILPPAVEPDSRIEFRFPAKPDESWDDLAFRFDGGEWIPFAVGGGVWPAAARKHAKVTFRRDGDSVVADVIAQGGEAEEVRFGAMVIEDDVDLVPVPYLTYRKGVTQRPCVLSFRQKGTPLFLSAMFDWTQTAASEPFPAGATVGGEIAANGGVKYIPKTDGKRNDVYERFVWTVSADFAATLPSVPNPVSPWKHVTGKGVWLAYGAGRDRPKDTETFVRWRRQGIRHLICTDHETMWRDGNESFTFKTNAAPVKGGDAAQLKHTRTLIDELGYVYGPYNNFTDFAPVNEHWNIDWVGRRPDGQLQRAWYRCYGPKPLRAVEACAALSPVNQAKFRFNTAYCDVHTAVCPWTRTDYDWRVPGAGTMSQVFYCYGEIMLIQKAAWGGPVYSEGGCQWPYWGLTDGNYAQDSGYELPKNPWLVDFDLRECHPKGCDFGMGYPGMFYGTGKEPKEKWELEDRFLAATVAFGHPGFFVRTFALDRHSYFMIQGVAARYTQANAREIRYADRAGRFHDTSAAVANGAWRESRVTVRYDDGTVTAANGGAKGGGDFVFKTPYGNLAVGPCNWAALAGDKRALAVSAPLASDGKTADIAFSEEYAYVNGRGRFVRTALGGTDGELVRDFLAPNEERVISRDTKGEVELPYVAQEIRSIGYAGRDNGAIRFTVTNGVTRFKPAPADWEIRVTRAPVDNPDFRTALEPYLVAAGRTAKIVEREEELPLPYFKRTGMVIRGGRPEPIDPDVGAKARETNWAKSGGVTKSGYAVHPPYKNRAAGKTGYVYIAFPVKVPATGVTKFNAQVGKSEGSTPGDGIFYRIEAESDGFPRAVLAEQCVKEYRFMPIAADLSAYRGKRVRLCLIADTGPANNSYGDGGSWCDLSLLHTP